jgi:hypothetical protein
MPSGTCSNSTFLCNNPGTSGKKKTLSIRTNQNKRRNGPARRFLCQPIVVLRHAANRSVVSPYDLPVVRSFRHGPESQVDRRVVDGDDLVEQIVVAILVRVAVRQRARVALRRRCSIDNKRKQHHQQIGQAKIKTHCVCVRARQKQTTNAAACCVFDFIYLSHLQSRGAGVSGA